MSCLTKIASVLIVCSFVLSSSALARSTQQGERTPWDYLPSEIMAGSLGAAASFFIAASLSDQDFGPVVFAGSFLGGAMIGVDIVGRYHRVRGNLPAAFLTGSIGFLGSVSIVYGILGGPYEIGRLTTVMIIAVGTGFATALGYNIGATIEEEQPAKTTGSPPVISSVTAAPTPDSLIWVFEATATDPDNDIVSYRWYFGDGAILQGGSVVKHTYSTAGTYQVCVKVWDKRNLTDKACKTIKVERAAQPPVVLNQPPRAEFRWSPLLPEEGQPVQFISDSTDPEGAIASLEWNFGDGMLGSGQTVTHIFTTPGNYRVCLTAKDTGGLSNQICKEIKIAQRWITPSNEKTRYFTSVISRDNNRQPTWSPDGKLIMFTSDRDTDWELYIINLETQAVNRVTKSPGPDFHPSWCRDGKVIFVSDRDGQMGTDLYILDMTTFSVTRLTHDPAYLNIFPTCPPDGRTVIFTTNRDGDFEIYSIVIETRAINRLTFSPVHDWNPQVSPDGRYIAFQSQVQGNSEIYVMDIHGRNLKRLTFNPGEDVEPAWSPDGKKIAFASSRDGNFKIYVIDATGENEVVLTPDTNNNLHPVWSPDGRKIAFESDRTRNWEIWVIDVDGKNLKRLTGVSK